MYDKRVQRLMNLIGEDETTLTRGSNRSGASAASAESLALQDKARNNPRVMSLLNRLGMRVEDLGTEMTTEDVEPFRTDVNEFKRQVQGVRLPSQLQKNQQRYNQLTETGSNLTAMANAQDLGTRKDVFQGNYTLQNLRKQMDKQQETLGTYETDIDYLRDKTDGFESYMRNLQIAQESGDDALKRDMYLYGMEKTDAAPEGMTLDEINAEINELVKEITDAQGKYQPVMQDPMGVMGSMVGPMQQTPVDTSEQEARLQELYAMRESGNYVTDQQIEEASKSYYDRYRASYDEELQGEYEKADIVRMEAFQLEQQALQAATDEEAQRLRDEAAEKNRKADEMLTATQALEDAAQADYESLQPKRDWGEYLGSGLMKGFSNFANAAYQTYDVVLGKPIDYIVNGAKEIIGKVFDVDTGEDWRNPLSGLADKYKTVNQKYVKEAEEAAKSMGAEEAWRVGQEVIGGLVQNIPNTILAFWTGGASAGVSAQNAAVKAMNAAGNSKTVQAVADMVSNPQYWLSFSQTVGNDYNDALEKSGSPVKAALYSMVSSLVNAGIEIGVSGTSGIQGINQADDGSNILVRAVEAVTGRDVGAFGRVIDSASDEALEELKQGIVSGLTEKVLIDSEKPYFSATDDNAIISLELGEQALIGGLTGGLMAGGAEVTNAGITMMENAQAEQKYSEMLAKFEQEERENAARENTQTEIESATNENMNAAGERVTDLSGEVTAFEYGKSGRSQEELEETLASSGIAMTDKERLAYTKGETERQVEKQQYIKRIQELNQGGKVAKRKGTFRSVSQEEAQKYGVQEFKGTFSEKQQAAVKALRSVAEKMHINMVYFESPTDASGNRTGANGFYDSEANTVYLDVFAGKGNEQAMMRAAAHELTHVLKEWSPDKYIKLQDELTKYYYSTGENTLRELVQRQIDLAKTDGRAITESQAMDEVTADACEMMFSDIDAMRQIANTDKTLFEKIGDWINQFVESIKTAMQGIRAGTEEARLLMESKETWEKARSVWYQALEEAGKNLGGADTLPVAKDVVSEVVEQLKKNDTGVKYSLRSFDDGMRFVDVQANQTEFDGLNEAEMMNKARDIIKQKFQGKVVGIDNAAFVNGAGAREYSRPAVVMRNAETKEAKMRAAGELDNLLDAGVYIGEEEDGRDGHKHKNTDAFTYYRTVFKVGNSYFEGIVNVANVKSRKLFKDVTKIKNITQDITSSYGENPKSRFLRDVSMNSISENAESVNDNVQFSMRDTEYKTDRELLATALESAAVTEEEQQMLKEYQRIAAQLDADEQRVEWLDAEIEKLRKQNPNAERIQEVQKERDALYRKLNKARKDIVEVENKLTVLKEVDGAEEEKAQLLERHEELTERIAVLEPQLEEIKGDIRKMEKEGVDTEKMEQLKEEKRKAKGKITYADRKLFQMEMLKPIKRIADTQRESAERAARRARQQLKNYKSNVEQKLEEAKTRLDDYREGVIQREYIGKIKRTSDRLAKWLTQPNNQRYVPEDLRKPLAEFLLAIDRGSETALRGGGMTKADLDYARVIADLRDVISNINSYQNQLSDSGKQYNMYIDLPRGFVEMMTEHAQKMKARADEMGGRMTLNRMNSKELEELFMTLTAISSSITHTNDFLSTENAKHVGEVSRETIKHLREQKPVLQEGKLAEFLNWDNLQPIYAFERYGEGGKEIFRMLQDGQSKLAHNTQEIVQEAEKLYSAKEVQQWSEDVKTFRINGQEVKIPVANIMSLYCLMRRAQGVGHVYGEGFRVGDYEVKGKKVRDTGHNVSDADVRKIIGSLTERQKDVAEKMQHLMSTKGSRWGNEVSMKRFGYRMFTERNYFPIEVDRTHLPARTDNGTGNELYRLLNMSSTKPITRGANNRIMLNNIFDVFSSHMSDMATYNSMALPVLDAVKWLNYKESELEEVALGEEKEFRQKYTESVRDAARDAYGNAANKYIIGVLKDINGAQMTGGEGYGKMMLGRVNRASVAANLRVAFLQPLSIVRAGMVLGTNDILTGAGIGVTHIKKNIEEMRKYSGIAVWKDLGFYDVNIGRGVKQMIKHDETKMDKLIDTSMKGAEFADRMTWALMWEGAKRNVARRMKQTDPGFMQEVARTFEEVVYKTQVVDSVLTRSQYMRNPGFFAKWTSSFMSEPTTTYNMLLNAYNKFATEARNGNFQQAWKKTGKLVLRTMSVYTVAAALNAVVESLMGAWRDEDDYTTFMEKFTGGYMDNFINNMMPFNKLPLVSDVYEYAKKYLSLFGVDTYGYGDTNVITQWLEQLYAGLEIVADKLSGEATNYTDYGAIYKIAQGMSSITGVPVASAMREAVAMWNNTVGYLTNNKIVVYKTSKSTGYQQMYNAIQGDNAQRAEEIREELIENGADDKGIVSGLRKIAKTDYLDGNLTDEEAATFLQKHCDMTKDEAFWKLEEWRWEAADEADDYSVYGELEEALLTGTGIGEAVKKLTAHGYESSKVQSKVREIVKQGYLDGDLTSAKAGSLLKQYAGLDDNEVYFKQQQYEYEKLTGDSTSSDACMIFYAIDMQQDPTSAINAALKHGKEKSGLASSITSRYKEQYLNLLKTNKSKATALRQRLAGIFSYLGYDGLKKIDGWTK